MIARRLCLAFLLCVAAVAPLAAQGTTLVFLVRHGEKAAQPAADPPLTPVGEARARALADALAGAGVGAVVTTQFARTRSTGAPLAEKMGLTMETVAASSGPAHAQAVAAAVRKHAGKAVLVVGHSNTITAITTALGGPTLPDLCDGDYDQLFILELQPTGPPRFTRAKFGAPAVDPACGKMQP